MTREEETALLVLVGVYLLHKYTFDVVPALENAGARTYEWVHDDAGHKNDLPGKQLTRQQVLAIATRAGFPNPKLASAIAFAESGGVPGAILRTPREYSVGLWQINTLVHLFDPNDLKDPVKNAAAAFKISKGGTDWRPWSTYTNGKYKEFLTGVFA